MKQLINWLKDSHHVQHTIVFFVVAIFNLFLLRLFDSTIFGSLVGAVFTTSIAGLAIEINEDMNGFDFSWQDIIADYIGMGIAILVFLLAMMM